MKVCESDLIHMKLYFKGNEEAVNLDMSREEWIEKYKNATMQMASKKVKRRWKDRKEINNLAEEQINQAKTSAATEFQVSGGLRQYADLLPPMDRNATNWDDVFKLAELIPEQDKQALAELSETFSKAEDSRIDDWKKKKTYSSTITDLIKAIKVKPDDIRDELFRALAYLHYLIKMSGLSLDRPFGMACNLLSEIPPSIKNRLNETYTTMGPYNSRKMSVALKDKLMLRIIPIVWLLNNYEVNVKDLSNETLVIEKRLKNLVTLLGGRCDKHGIAFLRLPLVPLSRRRTGIKRKR